MKQTLKPAIYTTTAIFFSLGILVGMKAKAGDRIIDVDPNRTQYAVSCNIAQKEATAFLSSVQKQVENSRTIQSNIDTAKIAKENANIEIEKLTAVRAALQAVNEGWIASDGSRVTPAERIISNLQNNTMCDGITVPSTLISDVKKASRDLNVRIAELDDIIAVLGVKSGK